MPFPNPQLGVGAQFDSWTNQVFLEPHQGYHPSSIVDSTRHANPPLTLLDFPPLEELSIHYQGHLKHSIQVASRHVIPLPFDFRVNRPYPNTIHSACFGEMPEEFDHQAEVEQQEICQPGGYESSYPSVVSPDFQVTFSNDFPYTWSRDSVPQALRTGYAPSSKMPNSDLPSLLPLNYPNAFRLPILCRPITPKAAGIIKKEKIERRIEVPLSARHVPRASPAILSQTAYPRNS